MSTCSNTISPESKMYWRRLYLVKRVQVEMVRDRGYDIETEANLLDASFNQFIDYYSNIASNYRPPVPVRTMFSRGYRNPSTGASLLVYYIPDSTSDSVGKEGITPFIDIVDSTSYDSFILITNNCLTPASLDSIKSKSRPIEKFMDDELIINPTSHNSVPFHEALSDQEKHSLLERNKWSVVNLPKLHPDDPIARYYGFKVGTVVRIHRFNPISGTMADNSLYYRIIPDPSVIASIRADNDGDDAIGDEEGY